MKRNVKWFLCAGLLALAFCGCSITQAIKLKDCTYEYSHISDYTFMEMTRSELLSIQGVSRVKRFIRHPSEGVKMGFTLHMKVTNPNKGIASVERLFYTVSLDDSLQVADGYISESFIVPGGTSADLALPINFSMNKLFSRQSKSSLFKLALNSIGLGSGPSKITVNLRPVVRVGHSVLSVPNGIPVTFEYPD